jgi:hypothetical protein
MGRQRPKDMEGCGLPGAPGRVQGTVHIWTCMGARTVGMWAGTSVHASWKCVHLISLSVNKLAVIVCVVCV